MSEKPKNHWRRWLQFRLSTWLVLVGIVAWTMALRPVVAIYTYHPGGARRELLSSRELTKEEGSWVIHFNSSPPNGPDRGLVLLLGPNPGFAYLLLTSGFFLVWKVAWWIVARRRVRATSSQEAPS